MGICAPVNGNRDDSRVPHTASPALRWITKKYLDYDIQKASTGHCSAEDATAAMKLVQLKILNGPDFGDPVSSVSLHCPDERFTSC